MNKWIRKISAVVLSITVTAACSLSSVAYTKPAGANVLSPTASGTEVTSQGGVTLDSSNKSQGYVMLNYTGGNDKIKVQIIKGGNTYTYDLNGGGGYSTFPLSEGSGNYDIKVYEHKSGNDYYMIMSKTISVSIADDKTPFLYPNQYVNFTSNSAAVQAGAAAAAGATDQFSVVTSIFNYVISNITYDNAKAASVQSGYVPNVDQVLASHTGICFDYAAVMAAMLRSQNIPTKLVIGYTGSIYHAWISVYLDGQGWVENVIYFDGVNWTLMDPTFASSNNKSAEILAFMANSANYQARFSY